MPRTDPKPDPFAKEMEILTRNPGRAEPYIGNLGVASLRANPGPVEVGANGLLLNPQTVAPKTLEGKLYYNLTGHEIQFWNGSAWIGISANSVGVASVAGTANQITVSPTTGNVIVALATNGTLPGSWSTAGQFISTLSTGTSPFVIASSTKVSNLNADLLDGLDSAAFALASHVHNAADITTGIFLRARLPTQVAYEDEANTFSLIQSFNAILQANALVRVWSATGLAADLLHFRDTTDTSDLVLRYDGTSAFEVRTETGGGGTLLMKFGATELSLSAIDWTTSDDGTGSGLDADLLDGQHGAFYQDAGNLNAGVLLDARVQQSNVTQHQAALSIAETQIPDGTILARVASAETISALWTFNAGITIPSTGSITLSGTGTGINMGNRDIVNANNISFSDPGVNEGLSWTGGEGWQIYESPDALTNAAGNVQFVRSGVRKFTVKNTLVESMVDFAIGSLGTFDAADTPLDGNILFYHAGATNKWQAESLQLIYNAGDTNVSLLADNTSTAYLYFDPGVGADSPGGGPPAPVLKLSATHKSFTVKALASADPDVFYHDGPSFPADFRHFIYEYSTDNFVGDTKTLATASSDKVVHGRLTVGTTYYYRARAVDRAGNTSVNSAVVSMAAVANSDTAAYGSIIASEISVDRLAALSADVGIITAGQLRNNGNTSGINLGGAGGIPGTWTMGINLEAASGSGSMTRYINFTASGSASFLKHERLELNVDGSVKMYQSSAQPMFKLDTSDFLLQNDAASPTQGVLIDGTLPGTWTRYLNLNGSGLMLKHDSLELNYDGSATFSGLVDLGGSGGEYILLHDPNVAHGMTDLVTTDTFGRIKNVSGPNGGMQLEGYTEVDLSSIILDGINGSTSPVNGSVLIRGWKKNGTGRQALAANEPVVFVYNSDATRLATFFGDGLLRLDGGLALFNGGIAFIQDTANTGMTHGLTINQAGAGDEILSFKSSSVAHPFTGVAEADTYGFFRKANGATGGIEIHGLVENQGGVSGPGLLLVGAHVNEITTKTTASEAAIIISGRGDSGTLETTLGANSNILAVRNSGTTRFILDGDGDSHQDVGTAWTNFDDHDDITLLTELSVNVSRQNDPLRSQLNEFIESRKEVLERLKLVTFDKDGHHFVNMSRLAMLLVGAVRQLGEKVAEIETGLKLLKA